MRGAVNFVVIKLSTYNAVLATTMLPFCMETMQMGNNECTYMLM